ncbi:MAG: DUF6402 family protein [Burkholderiales bacterium]|nr:DUF6402 family protein [Burkholderiales bacterium]
MAITPPDIALAMRRMGWNTASDLMTRWVNGNAWTARCTRPPSVASKHVTRAMINATQATSSRRLQRVGAGSTALGRIQ